MAQTKGARAPEFAFEKEENVLAYHGPLIYQAQVLDRCAKDALEGTLKLKLYLLHYTGWNSHWDEWVAESRVLKDTQANVALQKERVKEFQRAHKRRLAKSADGADGGKRQKPTDDVPLQDVRESLRLPHSMKLKLLEDWERITRERKLVPLPRSPSISELLEEFLQTKAKRSSHERLYGEVVDGMRSYFNQALSSLLLYKYERKQYRDLKETHKATPLVEIYGAEHLLRLYVKLPELLSQCSMQREHMTVLVSKLIELLKFIQANKAKYFVAEYEKPTDDYLAWWSGE
mmetsp:Transcript_39647/g.98833  ORF Transcript_39647/g.98833 Transcript_39647/m.98833 type:complete len:289 (-) Transcript_39647:180-1046(-)